MNSADKTTVVLFVVSFLVVAALATCSVLETRSRNDYRKACVEAGNAPEICR